MNGHEGSSYSNGVAESSILSKKKKPRIAILADVQAAHEVFAAAAKEHWEKTGGAGSGGIREGEVVTGFLYRCRVGGELSFPSFLSTFSGCGSCVGSGGLGRVLWALRKLTRGVREFKDGGKVEGEGTVELASAVELEEGGRLRPTFVEELELDLLSLSPVL